jgi:hypothetical protein
MENDMMTNPCSEIPLQNGRPSAVFYLHLEEPKTEEQMILYITDYPDALIKTKNGSMWKAQEYLKNIKWFYEKYKLLFDGEIT